MIPVKAQPEPASFDAKVRQKGLAYLRKKGIALNQPPPPGTKIAPYWRTCLDDLYTSYHGTCAYLAVFFERCTGAGSVDHFVAKSTQAGLAYEWSNLRLACMAMNTKKNRYDDVLDPFTLEKGWFHLELLTGRVFPNPVLPLNDKFQVQATIDRLELNDPKNKEMRTRHYNWYIEGCYIADYLQKISPFVWFEAHRQGLL
ncbi:MAG: hypothetical protein H7837_12645 [Magnetococcus sp. MYC-9]